MASQRSRKKKIETPTIPAISSITLGGFQVFDEPTTIPLGRLTFLFGPNSAGKSAVEDALTLIEDISDNGFSPRFRKQPGTEFSWLERHWRKVTDCKNGRVKWLHLGIETHIPTDIHGVISMSDAFHIAPGKRKRHGSQDGHLVGLTYRYQYDDVAMHSEQPTADTDEWHVFAEVQMALDGLSVLTLDELSGTVSLNLSHPVLSGWTILASLGKSSNIPHEILRHEDGWLHFDAPGFLPQVDWTEGVRRKLDRSTFHHAWRAKEIEVSTELREAFEMFADCFDVLYQTVLGNISISTGIVAASRTVPTEDDLTLVVKLGGDDYYWRTGKAEWGIPATGVETYKRLAKSALMHRWKLKPVWYEDPEGTFFDSVNHALAGYLFVDRGYQLAHDYKVILDRRVFENIAGEVDVPLYDCTFVVRIYLIDSQERTYSFADVGSGLGYVLPILCAVCDPGQIFSQLQQPELHLHPALQANMGDLFIDALNQNDEKQLIIETHSEHILLRVLKRIRQTTEKTQSNPELLIRPEDVSVVYFDPSPGGTTRVKRLRISEDGDFLDLWPRGFFPERDQELFGE